MDITLLLNRQVFHFTIVGATLTTCNVVPIEIRRKAMGIIQAMATSRNVEEVVKFLKKQLQRTMSGRHEKVCQYFCITAPV